MNKLLKLKHDFSVILNHAALTQARAERLEKEAQKLKDELVDLLFVREAIIKQAQHDLFFESLHMTPKKYLELLEDLETLKYQVESV